jgi:hypothetical protein
MILAAIWQQIAPFGPVLADSAGRKSFKNQRPAATLLPWHGRGRRFEPDQVHQLFNHVTISLASPRSDRDKLYCHELGFRQPGANLTANGFSHRQFIASAPNLSAWLS